MYVKKLEKFISGIILFALFANSAHSYPLFNETIVGDDIGLTFSVFDKVRCYNSTDVINPYPLSKTDAEFIRYRLTKDFQEWRRIDLWPNTEFEFKESRFFNASDVGKVYVEFLNNYSDTIYFETDGDLWMLRMDVDLNLADSQVYKNLTDKGVYKNKNFRILMNKVSQVFQQFAIYKGGYGGTCSITEDQFHPLLSVTDFRFSKYYEKIDCNYEKGRIEADCKNSTIFKLIPSSYDFWQNKESGKLETYKDGNNFIFLNEDDLELSGYIDENRYSKLGDLVVFSEGPFVTNFGNGQTIFVDENRGHLALIRSIDDMAVAIREIRKVKEIISDKNKELIDKNKLIDELFKSDKSLDKKRVELGELSRIDDSFLLEVDNKIENSDRISLEASNIERLSENNYHGLFYDEISKKYLSSLENELDLIKENREEYLNRKDTFTKNFRETKTNIDFQLENRESSKFERTALWISLVITIIVLFITLSLNILIKTSEVYSARIVNDVKINLIAILAVFFVVSLIFIKLDAVSEKGLNPLGSFVPFLFFAVVFVYITFLNFLSQDYMLDTLKKDIIKKIKKLDYQIKEKKQINNTNQDKIKYEFMDLVSILNKSIKKGDTELISKVLKTIIEIITESLALRAEILKNEKSRDECLNIKENAEKLLSFQQSMNHNYVALKLDKLSETDLNFLIEFSTIISRGNLDYKKDHIHSELYKINELISSTEKLSKKSSKHSSSPQTKPKLLSQHLSSKTRK